MCRFYSYMGEPLLKVDEIRQQLDTLNEKQIEIEGFLLVVEFGTGFDILISTTESVPDEGNVAIPLNYSLAELRKLIPPMTTMQLIVRGEMIHPPYYYRFPIQVTARLNVTPRADADEHPDLPPDVSLSDITKMSFYLPYAGKMAELVETARYLYQIQVMYGEYQDPENKLPARAKIIATKSLPLLQPDDMKATIISSNDNRYARTVIGQRVTIPGWIRYVPDVEGHQHYILQTFALRPSMVGVGPLRSMTSILWHPTSRYQVVRAHVSGNPKEPQEKRRVDITGQIAYLAESDAPQFADIAPSLYFTQIHNITVHEERYLLTQQRSDTLGDEDHAERAQHRHENTENENET